MARSISAHGGPGPAFDCFAHRNLRSMRLAARGTKFPARATKSTSPPATNGAIYLGPRGPRPGFRLLRPSQSALNEAGGQGNEIPGAGHEIDVSRGHEWRDLSRPTGAPARLSTASPIAICAQ